MSKDDEINAAFAFMSEVIAAEHLIQMALARHLPKGMEVSHFSLLNHLAAVGERSPAQLARSFNLTKGAMTNTLRKLEIAGYVHIRPDWDDARKKLVCISPAGERARDIGVTAIRPLLAEISARTGADDMRESLPILRSFRSAIRDL